MGSKLDLTGSARTCELNRFLKRTQSMQPGCSPVRVVIGNEAADLDSMVSAIMYAFFASSRTTRVNAIHIPVVNIPRQDFPLRTEAAYLFDKLGIDVSALVFVDEIDLDSIHANQSLTLTLVDHNILSETQARYEDSVAAIIDHHEDAGLHPSAAPREIEPVGSAATLVAEMILRDEPALVDAGTAALLLGTILLDTVNLDPGAKRVTAKDTVVADWLCRHVGCDPNELFGALQAAKFDVSTLGAKDLLRKDYKQWGVGPVRYGISSVLTSLANWIAKDPEIVQGMKDYARSRNLQCLITMMAFTDADNAFHRELAALAPDQALRHCLLAHLETNVSGLSPINPPSLKQADQADFFSQEDLSLSRKKLQPTLHRLFSAVNRSERDADTDT